MTSTLPRLAAAALSAALAAGATQLAEPGSSLAVFFSVSAWLNLVLALFNLLPGLPMDGGRALESLLGAVLLVLDIAIGRSLAVPITAAVGVMLGLLWFVLPLPVLRRGERDDPGERGHVPRPFFGGRFGRWCGCPSGCAWMRSSAAARSARRSVKSRLMVASGRPTRT